MLLIILKESSVISVVLLSSVDAQNVTVFNIKKAFFVKTAEALSENQRSLIRLKIDFL